MPDLLAPAHWWAPPYERTNGDIAAQMAELVGFPFDPEQRLLADAIYAESEPGVPLCFETCVVAPRQNLKTLLFQICALTDLFVMGDELIVWTAHLYDTTAKAFAGLQQMIEGCDDLRRQVRQIYTVNGGQAIELLTGQRMEFKARSKGGGRGLTGHKLFLDEALFLSALSMGALLPTLAVPKAAQVRYGSSSGMATSTQLRLLRNRGRLGNDPGLVYGEWAAARMECAVDGCSHLPVGVVEGCALDNRELWYAANSALGRRITEAKMLAFRRALPPSEFMRECLGWWEDPVDGADEKIPLDAWIGCRDETSQIAGLPRFVIDVTPDRKRSSLGACGFRSDGLPHGEVLRNDAGTAWLTDPVDLKSAVKMIRRAGASEVAVDGKSPAKSLVPDLEAAGLTVHVMSLDEMAAAAGALSDAVTQRRFRHLGQHELSYALAGAAVRNVGDGQWAWSRKHSDADISALVAVTAAFGRLTEPTAQPPATANTATAQPSNLYRPTGRLNL